MATWPNMTDALPSLATPEEVAEVLRKHPKTVRRMLKSGALPGVKVGNRWLVNLDRLSEQLGGRQAS